MVKLADMKLSNFNSRFTVPRTSTLRQGSNRRQICRSQGHVTRIWGGLTAHLKSREENKENKSSARHLQDKLSHSRTWEAQHPTSRIQFLRIHLSHLPVVLHPRRVRAMCPIQASKARRAFDNRIKPRGITFCCNI